MVWTSFGAQLHRTDGKLQERRRWTHNRDATLSGKGGSHGFARPRAPSIGFESL